MTFAIRLTRAKIKWNLDDPTKRNQFFNVLEAALSDVKGEDLSSLRIEICKRGPPDTVKYAAYSEPGASVTRSAELAALATSIYKKPKRCGLQSDLLPSRPEPK